MRIFFLTVLLGCIPAECKADSFFTNLDPSWQRSATLSYDEAAALFRQYNCTISSGSAVMYDLSNQRFMTHQQAKALLPEVDTHWTEFKASYQGGAERKQPCRQDIPWPELARVFQLPVHSIDEKVIIFIEPVPSDRDILKGHIALQKIEHKFMALTHYHGMKKYMVQIGSPKNPQ